jgi:hypothetical protein
VNILKYQIEGEIHKFDGFDYEEAKQLLGIVSSNSDNVVLYQNCSNDKNFIGGPIDNVLEYIKNTRQDNKYNGNKNAKH